MKAIIPVAGLGSRLRPHTHTQPKSLIPVAGKPILAHIVDYLQEVGVKEFVFIIGYMGDKIEDYINRNYPKLKSFFVVQANGKGTGHAIWLSRHLIENQDDLIVVYGDTIFTADKSVLTRKVNALGISNVEDPRMFGVAELNENGQVKNVVEKPSIPVSNKAMVGVYRFAEAKMLKLALNHLIDNDLKNKGEFHLTDAINQMIHQGSVFEVFDVDTWFDCGKKDILLETNAILLKKQGEQDLSSATIENCIIVPPVHIGEKCILKNSIIGPNVSIGSETYMNYCIVKNGIIGNESEIDDVHLRNSVVGNDTRLKGSALSLNLGDSTEIRMDY
jgi:glucose-1-phosphate thymidylyltransferase